MYLNALVFILGIGFVQGILMVAVLLSRKKIYPFHIFLNTYIAVILLQIIFKVASKLWLMKTWLQAYLLSYFIPFLYGPVIFLFALSYIGKDFKWKSRYALHFIPFLMYMSFYAFANPEAYPPSIMIFLLHPVTRFILQVMSLVVYHILVFSLVKNATGKNEINKFLVLE